MDILYPAYINSKKTIAEGRRICAAKACVNPTVVEISDCCSYLKVPFAIELDKVYPCDFIQVGRVRFKLKRSDETLYNPAIASNFEDENENEELRVDFIDEDSQLPSPISKPNHTRNHSSPWSDEEMEAHTRKQLKPVFIQCWGIKLLLQWEKGAKHKLKHTYAQEAKDYSVMLKPKF